MLLSECALALGAPEAAKAIAVLSEALALHGASIASHCRGGLCFVHHG
jgi:hypothetical protein